MNEHNMWPLDPYKHRSENSAKIRILNGKLNVILFFTGGQFLGFLGVIITLIFSHNPEALEAAADSLAYVTGLANYLGSLL